MKQAEQMRQETERQRLADLKAQAERNKRAQAARLASLEGQTDGAALNYRRALQASTAGGPAASQWQKQADSIKESTTRMKEMQEANESKWLESAKLEKTRTKQFTSQVEEMKKMVEEVKGTLQRLKEREKTLDGKQNNIKQMYPNGGPQKWLDDVNKMIEGVKKEKTMIEARKKESEVLRVKAEKELKNLLEEEARRKKAEEIRLKKEADEKKRLIEEQDKKGMRQRSLLTNYDNCYPQCINGKCLDGICVCAKSWAGDQCQTKLETSCKLPILPQMKYHLMTPDGEELMGAPTHHYTNNPTEYIEQLREIKNNTDNLFNLYDQKDYGKCNAKGTCPPPGAMTINELKDWSKKIREIREIKRCTKKECPIKKKDDTSKDMKVTAHGDRVLRISAKKKEGFSNYATAIPAELCPRMYLGPNRTTNMFNVV